MFHNRLNNVPVFRNCRDIDFFIALYGRYLNELKFDVKLFEIKAEKFQATFLILLAKLWGRGYWNLLNY